LTINNILEKKEKRALPAHTDDIRVLQGKHTT